mmetsp:Transcript_82862/g.130587  ORF Transcript_82862/g.130587 Transcript_82862/m.130587 type:complete len:624 (+) Transcript_82862:125-1996(+)
MIAAQPESNLPKPLPQQPENSWLSSLVKGETDGQRLVASYMKGDMEGQRLVTDAQRERDSQRAAQRPLFRDINELRKPQYDLEKTEDLEAREQLKYNDTVFGTIAKSKSFELLTMALISLNAVAIGYDADYDARWGKAENLYNGPIGFIVLEWIFAIYFTVEVIIRFCAYKTKIDCIFDAWFVFDTVLVLMMVAETWILPVVSSGGPLGMLSVLRLLRLLRITRMARLMRAVPEMMVIIKGMVAATRTVACTGALLVLVLYTFAILFTSEYHQGDIEDDSDDILEWEQFFGSMGKSMFTLFIMGTILDDYTAASNAIRHSGNTWMLLAFIIFTLISSFMMLNMLIGVLVEVVDATKEGEQNKAIEMNVREAIAELFSSMDSDANKEISRGEFMSMKKNHKVMAALRDLEIEGVHFAMYADLFFNPVEEGAPIPTLSYDRLVSMILRLRPGSFVSALDFATFAKSIKSTHERIKERIVRVEMLCYEIAGEELDADGCRMATQTSYDQAIVAVGSEKNSDDCCASGKQDSRYTLDRPAALLQGDSPSTLSALDQEQLDETASSEIIEELQRRMGTADLEKTGIPTSMLDDELLTRLKAVTTERDIAEFTMPGVPLSQDDNGIFHV